MDFRFAPLMRRYALVLLELCDSKQVAQALMADWRHLESVIEKDAQGWRFVTSPLLSKSQKQAVISKLSQTLDLSDLMRRFLRVLIQNNRLGLLEGMIRWFVKLWEEQEGSCRVHAQTASPLKPAEKRDLEQMLGELFERKIDLIPDVRPDVLGGVILSWGQKRLDASVATRLHLMCQQLQLEG